MLLQLLTPLTLIFQIMVDLLWKVPYTLGAIFCGVDKKPAQPSDARYYGFAMRIVGDFGATIAVPAIAGAILGVWLDRTFGTKPWFLILCLAAAFGLTGFIIQRKAKAYGKRFDELNKHL